MFDLIVQVSCEPIIKGVVIYVASGVDLRVEPTAFLIVVDVHRNVIRLRHPHEPMALQDPTTSGNRQLATIRVSLMNSCRKMQLLWNYL